MKIEDSKTPAKPDRGPIVQDKKPDWPHATAKVGTVNHGTTYYGDWIRGVTRDRKVCWV